MSALVCGCADNKDDTVKMITEATFPPYEFLRGQEIVGIDVEICRAVAQKLGKNFQCETVDFDSVIPAVISGTFFKSSMRVQWVERFWRVGCRNEGAASA